MSETTQKVTTEALMAMAIGETRTFAQGSRLGVESGRVLAARAGTMYNRRYPTTANYEECTITITREK